MRKRFKWHTNRFFVSFVLFRFVATFMSFVLFVLRKNIDWFSRVHDVVRRCENSTDNSRRKKYLWKVKTTQGKLACRDLKDKSTVGWCVFWKSTLSRRYTLWKSFIPLGKISLVSRVKGSTAIDYKGGTKYDTFVIRWENKGCCRWYLKWEESRASYEEN